MRIGLGTALLLAASSLVGLSPSPVAASTGCETPDTTWQGPATPEGSASWHEPTNWVGGVPTATSVVCIPTATTGPQVREGSRAQAGTVALDGVLTVAGSLDVATLEGDFGELHGPGTTTVQQAVTGNPLTLLDGAVLDLSQFATTSMSGEIRVYDGSRLNARGNVVLADGATIDSFGLPGSGLFTIANTGRLTLAAPDSSARVQGGFANHGWVTLTGSQSLEMLGASPEDALPEQFSTGLFLGAPGAFFNVSGTELGDAVFEHVTLVDHVTVPEGSSVYAESTSLAEVQLDGELDTNGATTLDAADVSGEVSVESGTLSVPSLAPSTLSEDGTLAKGSWNVYLDATLDLPSITTVDAWLNLVGPDASLGDSLANLTGIGPNGSLLLGADLAVPGRFRNAGVLALGDSRLDVGGKFRQVATGTFVTWLGSTGRGVVRAAGPRQLAGDLWVDRAAAYEPPVGTVLNIITSNGREGAGEFDRVFSSRFGPNATRRLRVAYGTNHVRLRVDSVG